MADVVRSKLSAIVLAIRTRLIDEEVVATENLLVSGVAPPEAVRHSVPGDKYLVLWPGPATVLRQYGDGAGRVDTRIQRRLRVDCWCRLYLDEFDQGLAWLTDTSLGLLDFEHAVIDALECFQPLNSSNDWLLTQPMKLTNGSEPRPDPRARGWGSSTLFFELVYEPDLDQAYQ